MGRLKQGDVVTIRKGSSYESRVKRLDGSPVRRASGDLAGVRCMVLDDPSVRASGASDKVQERVHLAPLESSDIPLGMLDVPTENLRRKTGLSAAVDAVRGVARAVFGGYSNEGRRNYEIAFGTDDERAVMRRTGRSLAQIRGEDDSESV